MASKTSVGAKPVSGAGDSVVHTWTLTSADPTGDAVSGYEDYADVTVQFTGTFGTATVGLEGSLDGGSNYSSLTDPQGNAISKTAAGIEAVAEAVPVLRPRLTTPGAGASIVVTVYMRKAKS